MYSEEKQKINSISLKEKIEKSVYPNTFGHHEHYNGLRKFLILFLSEANYNIYSPYSKSFDEAFDKLDKKYNGVELQCLSYEEGKEIVDMVYKEKEKRITSSNITLIGHIIILLWELDYLVISKIVSKIKKGLIFIKNKWLQIQQRKAEKRSLKKYKCLSKKDLLNLLDEYDKYIQQANDDNKYEDKWYPVCINEFYDCEYQKNN